MYENIYEFIYMNTQNMTRNSYMNSYTNKLDVRVDQGCSKYGDQGVPDPNDHVDFGFGAAAAASH